MLEKVESLQQRVGGVSEVIDRWLEERQELLVLFVRNSREQAGDTPEERGATLRSFCQILVDYVSAGHFEVYSQLIEEARQKGDLARLRAAAAEFRKVDATTEEILDFNDKYQETDDLSSLEADLSRLGEGLANRFEAEDRMIELLHARRIDQAGA